MEYVALNQHVKLLMDSLGHGSDPCNIIDDPTQGLLVERNSNTSTKIYSHEFGALTFLCVYVSSLTIGLILFCQNNSCEPWLSYGTMALISGCVLSIILHGCLQVQWHLQQMKLYVKHESLVVIPHSWAWHDCICSVGIYLANIYK